MQFVFLGFDNLSIQIDRHRYPRWKFLPMLYNKIVTKMHSKHAGKVGERLLAALVDEWAVHTPQQLFCYLPKGSNPSDGFHNVLFADLAHATDTMSWWIDNTVGRGNGEVLSYVGANDLRYLVVFLACCKTGYKVRTNLGDVDDTRTDFRCYSCFCHIQEIPTRPLYIYSRRLNHVCCYIQTSFEKRHRVFATWIRT